MLAVVARPRPRLQGHRNQPGPGPTSSYRPAHPSPVKYCGKYRKKTVGSQNTIENRLCDDMMNIRILMWKKYGREFVKHQISKHSSKIANIKMMDKNPTYRSHGGHGLTHLVRGFVRFDVNLLKSKFENMKY